MSAESLTIEEALQRIETALGDPGDWERAIQRMAAAFSHAAREIQRLHPVPCKKAHARRYR